MADHIVIDVMYWPPIDGAVPEFEGTDGPTSAIVRHALQVDAAREDLRPPRLQPGSEGAPTTSELSRAWSGIGSMGPSKPLTPGFSMDALFTGGVNVSQQLRKRLDQV